MPFSKRDKIFKNIPILFELFINTLDVQSIF